jgi:hypothetical protein
VKCSSIQEQRFFASFSEEKAAKRLLFLVRYVAAAKKQLP